MIQIAIAIFTKASVQLKLQIIPASVSTWEIHVILVMKQMPCMSRNIHCSIEVHQFENLYIRECMNYITAISENVGYRNYFVGMTNSMEWLELKRAIAGLELFDRPDSAVHNSCIKLRAIMAFLSPNKYSGNSDFTVISFNFRNEAFHMLTAHSFSSLFPKLLYVKILCWYYYLCWNTEERWDTERLKSLQALCIEYEQRNLDKQFPEIACE